MRVGVWGWNWEPVKIVANLGTPCFLVCPEYKEPGEQWARGFFFFFLEREQGSWDSVGRGHLGESEVTEG